MPADYSSLRLVQLPKTGGGEFFLLLLLLSLLKHFPDTLWASGYDIYDSLSKPYQQFLESLTVTFGNSEFKEIAKHAGFTLYDKPRGSPENVGDNLTAVHPLVRTNPVTGWKSVFPVGGHVSHINDVTREESTRLLEWFLDLLHKNHDLQVRFKWQNENDIGEFPSSPFLLPAFSSQLFSNRTAIWDNRSVFHTATDDYAGQGDRFGNRVVGIGERPYFDPQSRSRREELDLSWGI